MLGRQVLAVFQEQVPSKQKNLIVVFASANISFMFQNVAMNDLNGWHAFRF